MIVIEKLCKAFGDFVAVDNLSLTVKPGDVVGFLGPNGAGKSTTMKMITGFLAASSGSINVCDYDIESDPQAIKHMIGYLPEGAPAYGDMTVAQFLDFIADVRGLSGGLKKQRLQQVINSIELESVLYRPIDDLSKGFKRRVGLAQAIIHDPKVLILDEPTDGLDPNQKHQVRRLIQNLSKDKIVIISTHILEEVTAVCNRAVIIAQGKKLFDGTPEALLLRSKYHHAVTVDFASVPGTVDSLAGLNGVSGIEQNGEQITVFSQDNKIIFNDVFSHIQNNQWQVNGIYAEKGRMDDVFRELTVADNSDISNNSDNNRGQS
ncbi:MAG: ABC-2 type transport system ATP-binding protein [Phenylobacterium sp.]|jgi:ABC-2 type transport system ATP-binding protein